MKQNNINLTLVKKKKKNNNWKNTNKFNLYIAKIQKLEIQKFNLIGSYLLLVTLSLSIEVVFSQNSRFVSFFHSTTITDLSQTFMAKNMVDEYRCLRGP